MNLLITLQTGAADVRPAWAALSLFFYPNVGCGALEGGMRGLFAPWLARVQAHEHARVFLRTPVLSIEPEGQQWRVHTPESQSGPFDVIVSAVPYWNTQRLLGPLGPRLLSGRPSWEELRPRLWGAEVAYVVIDDGPELDPEPFNVHVKRHWGAAAQGGEVYMSFSARGDLGRVPEGHRAVTLSTHAPLEPWQQLAYAGRGVRKRLPEGALPPDPAYVAAHAAAGARLVDALQSQFPSRRVVFAEGGTPRTFERYTGRLHGAVGGVPLARDFTLFSSLPHRSASPTLWQIGDTSFPGQSVYACVVGARAAFAALREEQGFYR
jgi:phytoene dehydrogenase-like protein